MNYYENLNPEVKEYFKILCPEFPKWLLEYIETPEMKRISTISMSCGTDYSKCFNVRYWYSNLDHSVGVALIIWNFTHDKKQTLAGIFHDIVKKKATGANVYGEESMVEPAETGCCPRFGLY